MDILDIILAKALTPQGQVETYAAMARTAVTNAARAVSDAQAAITAVESIDQQAQANLDLTTTTLQEVDAALDAVEAAIEQIEQIDVTAIATEIEKLEVTSTSSSTSSATTIALALSYASETLSNIQSLLTLYAATGNSTTGSMTQAAITQALNTLREDLEAQIQAIPGGGGSPTFPTSDAGKIIIVGKDGKITTGTIKEDSIIETEIITNTYVPEEAYGIDINYKNRTLARKYDAIGLNSFDSVSIFGGRKRCQVDNNGNIIAFYGDANYNDVYDSGYQTMVYQPKFYYFRNPIEYEDGKVVREIIAVSPIEQRGFKVHPAFINEQGDEVDYVLLSAYESCAYNPSTSSYYLNDESGVNFSRDYLSSVAGTKIISGANNTLTIANAEALASNRGPGWHISCMDVENINQLLCSIEFCSFNGQQAIERGISDFTNYGNINASAITGSTSALGNATGHADATVCEHSGTYETFTDNGRRAISYRGVENPWGNMWKMLGKMKVYKDNGLDGGLPQIMVNGNYVSLSFTLPATSSWIAQFGYTPNYDNLLIPVSSSLTGNSSIPVGDYCYVAASNGTKLMALGGQYYSGDNNGLFYYAADNDINFYGSRYSARLVLIPIKNTTHDNNVILWRNSL